MKKYNNIVLIFTLFILSSAGIFAQEPVKTDKEPDVIDQKLEIISEKLDAELDYTELLEFLEHYENNPLDLNSATAQELKQLIFLNDAQVNNLLQHLQQNGKLISLYELQAINGFDLQTIQNILPYVKIDSDPKRRHFSLKAIQMEGKHQVFIRYQRILEEQKGFSPIDEEELKKNPNSRYIGSPDKVYFKYRFTYLNNISWGITAEKDAGEAFYNDSIKGFDFYSAHLYISNIGKVKKLAIGDYSIQFGQGLAAWSGMSFGKSSDVINIRKNGLGIRPYTSVDENRFMRGAATTVAWKKIEFTPFYSRNRIDANINEYDSVTQEIAAISSLQETGLHSTPNEIADKDALLLQTFGANMQYQNNGFNLGITNINYHFEHKLTKTSNFYNGFEFNGNRLSNYSADFSYIFRNMNVFGEFAQSDNGGTAYLGGFLLSLSAKTSLSVLYRNYERDYQSLYSSAFGEASRNINEQGLFTGLLFKPHAFWTVSVYLDRFSYPWLKSDAKTPTQGYDALVQVNYKPNKRIEMYARYKQEIKEITVNDDSEVIDPTVEREKRSYRFHISYRLLDYVTFKNRVEFSSYKVGNAATTEGMMIYQDVSYKPMRKPYALTLRYALFETDDYNNRIYTYENDVLYAYSIPAYFGKGSRYYLVMKYRLSRHLTAYGRISQFYYLNQSVIGSGLSEIQGNKKTEVKLQLRYVF